MLGATESGNQSLSKIKTEAKQNKAKEVPEISSYLYFLKIDNRQSLEGDLPEA